MEDDWIDLVALGLNLDLGATDDLSWTPFLFWEVDRGAASEAERVGRASGAMKPRLNFLSAAVDEEACLRILKYARIINGSLISSVIH